MARPSTPKPGPRLAVDAIRTVGLNDAARATCSTLSDADMNPATEVVAAAWWWQDRSARVTRARAQEVATEHDDLAETALRVAELEDRRAVVNQKLDVIVYLKVSQSGPVLLLDQISRELSDSVWLTDMTLSAGNISIVGEGLSELAITDFEQSLRLSSLFADTVLDYTQDRPNSVQFQLSTR